MNWSPTAPMAAAPTQPHTPPSAANSPEITNHRSPARSRRNATREHQQYTYLLDSSGRGGGEEKTNNNHVTSRHLLNGGAKPAGWSAGGAWKMYISVFFKSRTRSCRNRRGSGNVRWILARSIGTRDVVGVFVSSIEFLPDKLLHTHTEGN